MTIPTLDMSAVTCRYEKHQSSHSARNCNITKQ